MPIAMAIPMATNARLKVAGRRSTIMSETARPPRTDIPKSPRAKSFRNSQYCS
jgi:hypothetical protein